MPVIMKNNIPYGASSEVNIIETTMDNYRYLESSNLIDKEAIYCVSDVNNNEFYNAKGILFDDSKTNLGTRNVQHAIEKINATAIDYFDIFAFQGAHKDNISFATSENKTVSLDVTKEGYMPIGVVRFSNINSASSGTGRSLVNVHNIYISNNTVNLIARNTSTGSKCKIDMYVLVMYVKNEYYDYFKSGDAIAV